MALGIRYPGLVTHSGSQGGAVLSDFQASMGATFNYGTTLSEQHVAPSRYSEVRKVVFWSSVQNRSTGSQTTGTVRLRIGPRSTDPNQISIDTITVAKGDLIFPDTEWTGNSFLDPASVYEWQGNEKGNTFVPQLLATPGNRAAETIYTEFDRFDPQAAAFFEDWDAIAALGDDDAYVGYRFVHERDAGAWSATVTNPNYRLAQVELGMTVVQAPATVNRTSLLIPLSPGLRGIQETTFGEGFPVVLPWDASQWDGIVSINIVCKHPIQPVGKVNGLFEVRLLAVNVDSPTSTVRFTEDLSVDIGLRQDEGDWSRSSDIQSFIQDGDIIAVTGRHASGLTLLHGIYFLEIVLEDFSKMAAVHYTGLAGPIKESEMLDPTPDMCQGKTLFDPRWYDNMPDDFITSERVIGALVQGSGTNSPASNITSNADLLADMTVDPFSQAILPHLPCTPCATAGFKVANGDILQNNPIRLAGLRKLATSWNGIWNSGTVPVPGRIGLLYAFAPGNSEFLDQGPLFELGEFDPEGCAATSAGLGDPGKLYITNGSSIPKKFDPDSGLIEDAGVPYPFEGEVPTSLVEDTAQSPEGGLASGIYQYRYTFRNCCTGKESNPNLEDIEVTTVGAAPAAKVTLSFAGLKIPSDSQICEICVYRTVVGGDFPIMAKVGCFDPDLSSLFVDEVADDALDFLNEGISLLNAPMPCVSVVVEFRNRLFGLGDIPILSPAGSVSVIEGDFYIDGDGFVEWDRCLEGKIIRLEGDCRGYEIERALPPELGVSPPIGRLKLVDPYEGETRTDVDYTICGHPNRLYVSEPLEGECWPESGFLDIEPGDGDRLMGAISNYNTLVICKRRKTYLLSFTANPILEIIVPIRVSSDIGCIGPRTFAQMEVGSVWLADRGVAIFNGSGVRHVEEVMLMNQIFTDPDNDNYVRRDANGRVIDAVGVFYPKREQYLLLLPTVKTTRGCSLMLVWDMKLRNVTLLEFCQEFQSMVVAKDSDGNERVYLGDTNGFVWIYDLGDNDGVGFPNQTGTVRGTVTSAGVDDNSVSFLHADEASFIAGGLPGLGGLSGVAGLSGFLDGQDLGIMGVCLATRAAGASLDTPWTIRKVFASTTDTLYLAEQWGDDTPSAGDDFMLGAIEFKCIFKPNNYASDDIEKRNWSHVIVHEKETVSSKLRIELLPDFADEDPEELTVVRGTETGEGRTFDMSFRLGRQVAPIGRYIHTFHAVRFKNFAPDEPIRIINHAMRVTPKV